jgi:maleate cis-trans isomerase
MTVEYAPRGLIGVLTPQANTTVEPEFWVMLPPGIAMINARLMSPKATLEDRLRDYFERLDTAVEQFANAPIGVIAVATTGISYLAGVQREAEVLARIERRIGIPVLTSGRTVVTALDTLAARRIGLVSPYPEALTQTCVGYWEEHGFSVGRVVQISNRPETFHPIYSIPAADAQQGLDVLAEDRLDAIVMLGTGMPTLQPILERPRVGGAPVMSCMRCLAWASIDAVERRRPDADTLMRFVGGSEWGPRLAGRQLPPT